MANKNKGIRIGNYRITPLGIGALAGVILVIAAVVVLLIINPFAAPEGDGSVIDVIKATEAPTAQAVVTAVPTPVVTQAPEPRSATIRSLGEIAVQTNVLNSAHDSADDTYDFAPMFEYISSVMADADYTVGDVEGAMGDTMTYTGSGTTLITPSSLIGALKDCGVDMLNFANDHALDAMFGDLTSALANCKAAGMEYVGAASSQEEKDTPKIININDINVGFIAYTESLNGMEAKSDKDATVYGVNLISSDFEPSSDVQALRNAGADVVICYVSWGQMMNRSATNSQKSIAKALVEAGVDVIIGYNPHTVQPAFWLEAGGNRTLCLCSAGNFLSDVRDQYYDCGLIFQFTIREKEDYSGFEITDPVYIPTYVWRNDNEDGTYTYRTLAIGQWRDTQPEGMDYTQYSHMLQVWSDEQNTMGQDVATIAAE